MSPAKTPRKARGGKQNAEENKKVKVEPVQSKKGGKTVTKISQDTTENRIGRRKDKGGEEQAKKADKVSKGKAKKDEGKNGKLDPPEKTQDEETEHPKRVRRGKQQNGKVLLSEEASNEIKGKRGKGKAVKSKPNSKTPQTKATSKTPEKRGERRGLRVEDSEEDETETEKEKSEQQSEDSSEEEKEEESDFVEEPAETEASKVSSEEEILETETKTEQDANEGEEEEKEKKNEDVDESSGSESKVESKDEPISSEEETELPEEISEPEDKKEQTTVPSKKPLPLSLTSHLPSQKKMLKSKILRKKEPHPEEKPEEDSAPSLQKPMKRVTLSKTDAMKGKSQILQLANKTKTLNKKGEVQKEEEAVISSKKPKGLLNKPSRMLFTIKGKGKEDGNKPAAKEDQLTEDEINEESVEKQKPSILSDNTRLAIGKVKIASLSNQAKKKKDDDETVAETAEPEEAVSSKSTESLLARKRGMATLRRVSGWIQKNMPRSFSVRRKLSAVTQAIGVSKWLPALVLNSKKSRAKTKKSLLRHRMAMKMAGSTLKTNKRDREDTKTKEMANTQDDSTEGLGNVCDDPCSSPQDPEENANSGDAKFAIVFPRMNKVGKAKNASVPAASTSTGSDASPERKPPKPGARLVLPVKPDLSLLKSVKKINTTSRPERTGNSEEHVFEDKKEVKADIKSPALGNTDSISVLHAAKGKLGGSQVNLTKLSMSKSLLGGGGQSRDRQQNERNQAVPSTEAELWRDGVGTSFYEEEADREVAELMGEEGFPSTMELHWAQNRQMCGDPQDWLRSENLLPHQTVEKLARRTLYEDDDHAQSLPIHNGRGPWESEDPTQNMLEGRLNSTQV